MQDYTVICEYRKHYPHNAIFLKTNFLNENHCDQLNKLKKIFQPNNDPINSNNDLINSNNNLINPNIAIRIYEKDTKINGHYCAGYDINGSIDTSVESREMINYWINFTTDSFDADIDESTESSSCDYNKILYYINGEDKYLSPIELHNRLLSMTDLNGLKITVDNCFIISEVPINYHRPLCLRFFAKISNGDLSKKWVTCDEIKTCLSQDNRIIDTQLASSDGKLFAGYGFIYVDKIETLKELCQTSVTIDDITINYDSMF